MFYTKALGLMLRVQVGSTWAEIDAGNGFTIGLHPGNPPTTAAPGMSGAINIELNVDEPLEDVIEALEQRGVSFNEPIQSYADVRIVPFSDPDGNRLLLAQVLNSGVI